MALFPSKCRKETNPELEIHLKSGFCIKTVTKAAVSCCELGVSFTREHKAPFDQEPRASGVWAQEGLRLHSRRVCGEQSPGRAQGPAPAVPQDLWQGSEQSRGRGKARLSMPLPASPSTPWALLLQRCCCCCWPSVPTSGGALLLNFPFWKKQWDNNYCKHGPRAPQTPQIHRNRCNPYMWGRGSSVWTQNSEVWEGFGVFVLKKLD